MMSNWVLNQLPIKDVTWQRGPNLPRPIKGQAQGEIGGKIVYACGFAFDNTDYRRPGADCSKAEVDALMRPRQIRYSTETWLFDPTSGQFSPLPDAPVGVFWPGGIAVANDFYLLTGTIREVVNAAKRGWQPGERKDLTSNRIFRLSLRNGAWAWEELPPMRIGRFLPAVAAVGTTLYVIGGEANFGAEAHSGDRPGPYINAVEALDLDHLEEGWRDVAPLPGMGRYGSAVAVAQGKIYLFGGVYDHLYHVPERHSLFCGDAYCYDPETKRWDQLPDLPFALQSAEAVAVRDRYILLIAGHRGGSRVEHPFSGDKTGDPRANLDVILYDILEGTYTLLPTKLPPGPANPFDPPGTGGWWIAPKATLIGEDTIYLLGAEVNDLAYSNCTDAMWIGTIHGSETQSGR